MFYSPSLKLGRRDSISVGEMAAEKKRRRMWDNERQQGASGGRKWGKKEEEWGRKNWRNRKRVKPDWECLPRVVLVTLNYKWSLTFQAKTHNHNIIPMMHFHWQATLHSLGLALATNLCPLPSFSSVHLPIFSAPGVKDFANFYSVTVCSVSQSWHSASSPH